MKDGIRLVFRGKNRTCRNPCKGSSKLAILLPKHLQILSCDNAYCNNSVNCFMCVWQCFFSCSQMYLETIRIKCQSLFRRNTYKLILMLDKRFYKFSVNGSEGARRKLHLLSKEVASGANENTCNGMIFLKQCFQRGMRHSTILRQELFKQNFTKRVN